LISLELIIKDNQEFRNFQIDLFNKFSDLIQKIESLDYFDEQNLLEIFDLTY